MEATQLHYDTDLMILTRSSSVNLAQSLSQFWTSMRSLESHIKVKVNTSQRREVRDLRSRVHGRATYAW
jgi:hypothetical protein